MDFSAISLRIKSIGDREAIAALDQIDRKAQATAKQVNDIFDNTLYRGSLRDAEADFDRLFGNMTKGADKAAAAVQREGMAMARLHAEALRMDEAMVEAEERRIAAVQREGMAMARLQEEALRMDAAMAQAGAMSGAMSSRLQQLAVSGSLVGTALADGSTYGVMRFARTLASVGFVINPLIGGLGVLAATVGESLFLAFEKSKKEAEAFRKSLTDLINAGQTAKIGEQIYDVEVGTAAENYEDGLVALKAKLATVEARFKEQRLGGQSAQIQELQGKIATAQSKLDELLRAQQLAMRSSAYYDQQNEAGTKTGKKDQSADLRDATGDFGDGADQLTGIDAAAKAAVKRWDEIGKETVKAMEENHKELVATYDKLNNELAKHIKVASAKNNPLLAEQQDLIKQIDDLGQALSREVDRAIGHVLADAIQNAFAAAFSGKGIGGGIEAFGKTILKGMGQLFEQLGEIYLAYGLLMARHVPLLGNPVTAAPAAIKIGAELIAMGAALSAVTSGKGGGGGGYSGSYGSSLPTIVTSGIVAPSAPPGTATPAGSVNARPSVTNHNYIIGPADPVAQRMWDELQRRSLQRGSIRGA